MAEEKKIDVAAAAADAVKAVAKAVAQAAKDTGVARV